MDLDQMRKIAGIAVNSSQQRNFTPSPVTEAAYTVPQSHIDTVKKDHSVMAERVHWLRVVVSNLASSHEAIGHIPVVDFNEDLRDLQMDIGDIFHRTAELLSHFKREADKIPEKSLSESAEQIEEHCGYCGVEEEINNDADPATSRGNKVEMKEEAETIFDSPPEADKGNEMAAVKDNTTHVTPSNIIKLMNGKIAELKKDADAKGPREEDLGEFLKNCAAAFVVIVDFMKDGTVDGHKRAQIHMSKLMSPMIQYIPNEVYKFIISGNAKPALKDIFQEIKN